MGDGTTRVLVIDDHPVVGKGLTTCMSVEPDLEVCAVCKNEEEATRDIKKHKPDLIIIDVWLDGADGLALAEKIHLQYPKTLLLVYSMFPSISYAKRSLMLGAKGYVTKDDAMDEVVAAVREIRAGGTFVSAALRQTLFENLALTGKKSLRLTKRETEVYALLEGAASRQQIARAMGLSVRTVDAHLRNLVRKLGVPGVPELRLLAAGGIPLRPENPEE